ncbi:hypothetical protein [Variovorax guangxiensis]|uniref:Uncharacterized protein n=1 Tax=Variovorax guangxiensis TaxID=1775474 RepID=A0A502DJI1_9BURK|nr:hypothetical protein [Variovorax guangxiensis]TPG20736.1 hypothetical protein EAH83_18480 [Variovorax ginsengisoli]TPG25677.1 hypothetical protein EAH82_14655 [Variovorax guangxiensis]
MNTESDQNVPEVYRRIVHRAHRLLDTLEREYLEIKPEHGATGFRERVFNRMNDLAITKPAELILSTGEVCMEKVTELIKLEGDAISSDLWWIYGACANVVASSRALNSKDLDRAWELMCDAHTPTGAMLVTNRAEEILTKHVFDAVNKERASNAAKGRHHKSDVMKKKTHEILRSRSDWAGQARAKRVVIAKLKAEYGQDALKNFEDTVEKWIRDMPDRLELIPSLKERLSRSSTLPDSIQTKSDPLNPPPL